jgi:hypothetical protein
MGDAVNAVSGMGIPQIVAWTAAAVVVCAAVALGLRFLLRGKDFSTPIVKITEAEKERIQSDSRELSDNQMRAAKIHIGSLRVLLLESAEKEFPDMSQLEQAYLALLVARITDNLLEQFRIDLVRNHIVKKTPEELQVYTRAKATMYYTKIRLFLCDYNLYMPSYDLKKIVEQVPFKQVFDIYLESYTSARQLSTGY